MFFASPSDRSLLHGKRILIIEGDDELFRALTEILAAAGCAVTDATMLGAGEHASEASVWVLDRVVDLALVDDDPTNSASRIWIQHLKERGIPMLIAYDPACPHSTPNSCSQRLRKPFTELQLLDSLSEVVAFGARAPCRLAR